MICKKSQREIVMTGTEMVAAAKLIAKLAHKGQKDKAGMDYFTHPEAVAAMLDTPEEKTVAYLHDTVEDTDVTVEEIRSVFGNEIADEFIKAINNVLMLLARKQIYLSFEQAQKEVDDLHKRTAEGIKTAQINGKQIGQKKGTKLQTKKAEQAKQIILRHSIDFGGTLSDSDVIRLADISRNSFYKYKRELQT